MCKTSRSSVFFCSAVHVFVAVLFLLLFLIDTIVVELGISVWKCKPLAVDRRYVTFHEYDVHYYLDRLFKFVYYILLTVTGIYMFRAVDRKAAKLLKFSALSFMILQALSFIIFVLLTYFLWENVHGKSYNSEGQNLHDLPHYLHLQFPEDTIHLTVTSGDGQGNGGIDHTFIHSTEDVINNNGHNELFASDELIPIIPSSTSPPKVITTPVYPNYNNGPSSFDLVSLFGIDIALVAFNSVGTVVYILCVIKYLVTL